MSLSEITKKIFILFFHVFTIDAIPSTIVTTLRANITWIWYFYLLFYTLFENLFETVLQYIFQFFITFCVEIKNCNILELQWLRLMRIYQLVHWLVFIYIYIHIYIYIYIYAYIFYILLYMYTCISDIFLIYLKHRISFKVFG